MNGTALDLKEYADQKDMLNRYGRQDIIYDLLDKRIDHLADDIKDLKGEVKEIRGDIKDLRGEIRDLRTETTQRIDGLYSQMVSMKTWGIGLLVTIIVIVLAPHIAALLG